MYQIEVFLRLFWYCAVATHTIPDPAAAGAAAPSAVAPLALSSGKWTDADAQPTSLVAHLLGHEDATPVSAPEESLIPHHAALTDRFFFALGGGLMTTSTEARLDSAAGLGTTVNFENLLGLDATSEAPLAQFRWRFSDRWRLELEWFQLNRSSKKQLTGDIEWNGQTYPVDTVVDAKFNTSVTRLSCGYSFFKTEDKDFGVALGFHVTDFDIAIKGSGGNGEGGAVLAPLPVLSTYGQVALTDHWAVATRLDAFKLEYDPYRGHIFSIGVDVLYQPWEHVGFGLSWRSLDIGLGASNNDWDGQIRTRYQGPSLFVSGSF